MNTRKFLFVPLVIVIVAVVLVLSAVGWYVFLSPRPKIAMTDVTLSNASPRCGTTFNSLQTVGANFTLVNTGNENGLAVIAMTGGGSTLGQNAYFVPAGQSVTEEMITATNCSNTFAVNVWVSQVSPW
jgi:hypothetical protein